MADSPPLPDCCECGDELGANSIQAMINQGYAISASLLGQPCHLYHPVSADNPLSVTPTPIQAAFDTTPTFTFVAPSQPGKAIWYALVDRTGIAVGDYLVSPASTYFVYSMDPMLPTMVIECNRVLTIRRPTASGRGGGKKQYGGDVASTEADLMVGWPASLLQGTKGEKADSGLPGDTRNPWYAVMLPFAGVEILPDDVIVDELEHRYKVSSVELTASGLRLTAMWAGV